MTSTMNDEQAVHQRPPNILLVTTDQQHHEATGLTNPLIRTPALQGLAAGGLTLSRAYCNNPLCSPSRSTIITGEYPSWHGCWTIGTKLDEDRRFLGDELGAAGYATSLIGKAHFQPLASRPDQTSLEAQPTLRDLDFWRSFHGPYYGFEHIELARNHADESHVGQHYAIWMEENGLPDWRDFFRAWPPSPDDRPRRHLWELPAKYHYSTWTADRTIASIERAVAADSPFFLWSSFHDPHPPYLVPEPYATMYDPADMVVPRHTPGEFDSMAPWFALTQETSPDFSRWQETPYQNHGFTSHLIDEETMRKNIAVYYGMITFIDDQLGRILSRLEELGIADNTIVVFTTDHGHFLGQHGLTAKGAFHYEDLLRLPFVVRWPGHIPAGTSSNALLGLVDLAPSFLDAAGADIPGRMQGISQLDAWRNPDLHIRGSVVVENRHQPSAVDLRTYITDRYKLTLYRGHDWGELFDLKDDPDELHNLFHRPEHAELVREMALAAVNSEIEREPTRYQRIAGA